MKVEFTGRNFTVSPAIKKHTQEHFAKLDSLLAAATKAHVILSIHKHHQHVAEIVVYWKEHELTSTVETADMYASVAQAINKLHRQAQKLKGKIITRKHHAVPAKLAAPTLPVEIAPTNGLPRIIRSRRYSVKPMTPEEAMLQVASDSEQFLVFRDAETERIGVMYKRKDGNFGLIEP